MKVLFFISVHGHGRGGHFHSLDHIARQIGTAVDAKIISIGPGNSTVIRNNPFFSDHFHFSGLNIYSLRKKLKIFIDQYNPDLLHFFDESSYNVVRLLLAEKKCKVVVNKCGGPNPKRYPHVHNLILFSSENLEWFRNQQMYQNSNIHLISNRVKALIPDKTFQPIAKRPDEFVFLRICRISATYKKSILDSIGLVENLLSKNIGNIKLYVIGVVEDSNLYGNFKEHPLVQSGQVIFLTDPVYTNEASKMLYLADAVIGTGRGLMESASLAIPILTINAAGNVPVLLNSDNFLDAFKTNFSERNVFTNFNHDENMKNVQAIVQDRSFQDEMSKFSKEVFEQYFNLDKVTEAYLNAYATAISGGRNLLVDSDLIIRSFVKFARSYLKARKR